MSSNSYDFSFFHHNDLMSSLAEAHEIAQNVLARKVAVNKNEEWLEIERKAAGLISLFAENNGESSSLLL